jgi:hypothetical protein
MGNLRLQVVALTPLFLLAGCHQGGSAPSAPLLGGSIAAPATDGLPRTAPLRAPAADISRGALLSRLSVVLRQGATVGQVNAALSSVGATGFAFSAPGSPFLTVIVPRQSDARALEALAAHLRGQSGILAAAGGQQIAPQELPAPGGASLNPGLVKPLLPAHFPAAWNARDLASKGCETRRPVVVVPDTYFGAAPADFETHVPGALANFSTAPLQPIAPEPAVLHGYDVLGVLAGQFTAGPPVGANPLPDCLDIFPVDLTGMDMLQTPGVVAQAIADRGGAKMVVNFSFGFGSSVCGTAGDGPCLTEADIEDAADRLRAIVVLRASAAILWAAFAGQPAVTETVLFAVAGGNEKEADLEQGAVGVHYAGFRDAQLTTDIAYATQLGNLRAILSDPARWTPDAPTLPVLLPEPDQIDDLVAKRAQLAPVTPSTSNLTLVGSTSSDGTTPSAFSNDHTDLFAAGEEVVTFEPDFEQGTSFAAPQVAGLASYLWLLDDGLHQRPVAETLQLIRTTASASGAVPAFIDAYAAVTALDARNQAPKVRTELLDANGDSNFDHLDLLLFAQAMRLGDPTAPTIPVPDYSRFDLNGEGTTGGIQIRPFDLDLDGGVSGSVTETIEGYPVDMTKGALSDLQILCYYAYNDGFYAKAPGNHDEAITARSDILGPANCVDAQLAASFPSRLTGATPVTLTATTGVSGTPAPDMLLQLTGSCATVAPTSGRTDANGHLAVTVTPGPGCRTVQITAKASGDTNSPVLAQKVFTSSTGTLISEWGFDVSSRGFLTIGTTTITLDDTFLSSSESHIDPTGDLDAGVAGTLSLPGGKPYTFGLHAEATGPTATSDQGSMSGSAGCIQAGAGGELSTGFTGELSFGTSFTSGFTISVSVTAARVSGDPGSLDTGIANATIQMVSGGDAGTPIRADLSGSPTLSTGFTGHLDPPASLTVELSGSADCLAIGDAGVTGGITWSATPD